MTFSYERLLESKKSLDSLKKKIAVITKNMAKADKIRDLLLEENIEIIDTKEGATWKLKE